MIERLPDGAAWLTPVVGLTCLAVLSLVEVRRPLRARFEAPRRRMLRNVATGAVAQVVSIPLRAAVLYPLSVLVEQRGWGLLQLGALPPWATLVLGLVLMDYTLWHWHRFVHRVPFLWRFHAVHHADLEMDASTALRFHFGEVALGTGWLLLQVLVLGISPATLGAFSAILMASVLFHHSNVRLPESLERHLGRLIATPRLHAIHHSIVAAETNSNYSSLLTAWDVLHGTMRRDPQSSITIGIEDVREPADLTFTRLLMFPFRRRRAARMEPAAGE